MTNTFTETSKSIANKFIKSVVLADDEVLEDEFNAKELISAFANDGKICSIVKFESDKDNEQILQMDQIADVTILDWKIHKGDMVPIENETDAEEDVEEDEIRGRITKPIIQKITAKALELERLKLIIIYTTEHDLPGIIDRINEHLTEKSQAFDRVDEFTLQKDHIRISVFGKQNLKTNRNSNISNRAFDYEELPQAILEEFCHLTDGIVPNTVLKSITLLRENTFKLLKTFSSDLDVAFLAHRAMLPNPEDAGDLLISTIIESFNSILAYSDISKCHDLDAIKTWINNKDFEIGNTRINGANTEMKIDKPKLVNWQESGYKKFFHDELKIQQAGKEVNESQWTTFDRKKLLKETLKHFTPKEFDIRGVMEKFAILTHHKSNFHSTSIKPPQLTLGSVVMSYGFYYLCIQQPCDSVRIASHEQRKFLFLRLIKTDDDFSIVFKDKKEEFIKLKICKNSYDVRSFNFYHTGNGSVTAKKMSNGFCFKDVKNKRFTWILDLKKSHAQKISNEFSANLSRVGIDESEWLRRS